MKVWLASRGLGFRVSRGAWGVVGVVYGWNSLVQTSRTLGPRHRRSPT